MYEELRQLAAHKLAQEKPGQTLQATALVHEAFVRLVDVEKVQRWDSRGHFFAAAAEAMRRILIETARRKSRPKHGGDRARIDLDAVEITVPEIADELLPLDDALTELANTDPQAAHLALTTVLRRKGRVLDALTDGLATLRRHLSSEDQVALGQLATLRAQLATWTLKGAGGMDAQQRRAQISQFEAQAQQLEAQISARSAAFRAQSRLVTIGEVQQHIP